ncbi:hypothetical protein ALC62_07900 [Cyphomyrmex costatus]|uniref:Uncharacterized protein n=1 Tax=Cyphomyrmex costatus TaxID=456900 RepID=A0A195CKN3_9HYME|nr:hypothetical protein ALC62_07900 [Cyphomyrmex costatus]
MRGRELQEESESFRFGRAATEPPRINPPHDESAVVFAIYEARQYLHIRSARLVSPVVSCAATRKKNRRPAIIIQGI